jgi:alkylated DNA nucleotide flippase Atl1
MIYKRKSWQEKLDGPENLPKVVKIEGKMTKKWGSGTVVIPKPREVDALMKKVPKGKVTTINEIRAAVAKKHQATIGCPITCGIFANIAAHAADEEEAAGKKRVTPYWRTLRGEGELNEKYPGGMQNQASRLKAEGLEIEWNKNKTKAKVKNIEKYLIKF